MADATKCTVTGDDAEGKAARTSFWSDTAAHALALANLIQDASNARLPRLLGFSLQAVTAAGPTDAQFASTQNKLVLIFSAGDNTIHKYSVPAPKVAQFDANQRTVTYPDGGSDDLIAGYLANAFTPGGLALSAFISGHQGFRKSRKF